MLLEIINGSDTGIGGSGWDVIECLVRLMNGSSSEKYHYYKYFTLYSYL